MTDKALDGRSHVLEEEAVSVLEFLTGPAKLLTILVTVFRRYQTGFTGIIGDEV